MTQLRADANPSDVPADPPPRAGGGRAAVDRAAREARRLLGPDPAAWVRPVPGVDHDVAVVGGGQSGVAIAFALRRAGIGNVTVLDAAADEEGVGGWSTVARMRRLRTGKDRGGPDLGIPALSPQAWYEGLHGTAAWQALDRIGRTEWADYLRWFREQVGVEVRRRTRVLDIRPADGRLALRLDVDGRERTETARKVVLATGVEGSGGPYRPRVVAGLPSGFVAHTGEPIDFAALRGRSVAVLGAASSAFDAAAAALEAGAGGVHLFSRRSELVVQPLDAPAPSLAREHFHELPDDVRWASRLAQVRKGASVPWDSVARVLEHDGIALHLNAPWRSARVLDGKVVVEAGDGTHAFDFVVAGTGYQYDPATRPELAGVAADVALWRDVYEPPAGLRSDVLGGHPYLGPGYQLVAKDPATPGIGDIHLFNLAATQSFGLPVGDIPSLRTGVPRLVAALASDLFHADRRRPAAPAAGQQAAPQAPFRARYEHAVWRPDATRLVTG